MGLHNITPIAGFTVSRAYDNVNPAMVNIMMLRSSMLAFEKVYSGERLWVDKILQISKSDELMITSRAGAGYSTVLAINNFMVLVQKKLKFSTFFCNSKDYFKNHCTNTRLVCTHFGAFSRWFKI